MKYVLILFCLIVSLSAQSNDTLRVLFIGNSHTYFNNLPLLLDSLSESAGRPVITGMSAPGGYTLEQHANTAATIGMIQQGNWHYVVLQEQSQIPTINFWRFNSMYPACRRLDSIITANNESTAFFMTWGWKYGGVMTYNGQSSPPFINYFHMQESVRVAYESIATELSATLCPVGLAWKRAKTIDTLVDLWMKDNYHPTLKGSYLAACVFYAKLFSSSPVGLSYTAGLSLEDALFFQNIAWQTISISENNYLPLSADRNRLKIYPNPFRATTVIRVSSSMPRNNNFRLSIYDVSGKCIKTFAGSGMRNAVSAYIWDGKDENNHLVPNGVYFCQLTTARQNSINKILLVR